MKSTVISTVIFTGGGSGGHVVPAMTLIATLQKKPGIEIVYIGSYQGIERHLMANQNIKYCAIFTGKLRRYFSLRNFLDVLKLGIGLLQAVIILLKYKKQNSLIFSVGGFVSVPVVIAGRLTGKTIYIHEQTTQAGLANRICARFASKIFISFADSKKYFPEHKTTFSGYPLRPECFTTEIKNCELAGIKSQEIAEPILFVTGGGNGSLLINNLIDKHLTSLKAEYFIVHQVGNSFIEEYKTLQDADYLPLAYIGPEMIDLIKLAKVIISRAGANSVGKPCLSCLFMNIDGFTCKPSCYNDRYRNKTPY